MHDSHARNLSPENPFLPRQTPDAREAGYARAVNALARRFIYDEGRLDRAAIERAIAAARKEPGFDATERKQHGLESLLHLLNGIESHERANTYFCGAWQAAIIRQEATNPDDPKPPEALTREEIGREFDAFRFNGQLRGAESEALTHYGRLLETNPDPVIPVSQNIRINRPDIGILINDLRVREAERIPDDAERTAALRALDVELAKTIERIPDEDWGKRFEIEEIYLLRRLIHAADMGHLASVNHGTPREDLRQDHGSVDITMTAAGDVLKFQLKTFKRGVQRETRAKQEDVYERARGKLEGSGTRLAALRTESVQETYEASLRQTANARTSRADKYAALEPLVDVLDRSQRHRLLVVLGLTEQDLATEKEAFEERVAARKEFEREMTWKQHGLRRIEQESKELEAAKEREALERTRVRLEAEEQLRLEALRASEAKRAAEEEKMRLLETERKEREETIERRAAARRELERQLQEKREAIARSIREATERKAAEELETLEQKRARIEKKERQQLEAINASKAERDKIAAAKKEKADLKEIERKAREEERREREDAERREAEKLADKQRKAEARLAKKKEKGDWPPETLVGMVNAATLQRIGMLPSDWKNDAQALLRAKKEFFRLFGKPKRGATAVTEQDKPNAEFGKIFASRKDFESPDDATRTRLRLFTETK